MAERFEAMMLSEAERTELAYVLVKSLDQEFFAALLKLMKAPRSLLTERNSGG